MEKRSPLLFVIATLAYVHVAHAKIRNGYENQIHGFRESLKCLEEILKQSNLPVWQRLQIKSNIYKLREGINYYSLTHETLIAFRNISPDLYEEIDTIANAYGEPVDVYVTIVPEQAMHQGISGTTNLAACADDPNRYRSEFGTNTVSVRLAGLPRAMTLLAHEFGHVHYQVPNLASYLGYFAIHYQDSHSSSIGHNDHDPSGTTAMLFEAIHHEHYKYITRNTRIESPVAMFARIRKRRESL